MAFSRILWDFCGVLCHSVGFSGISRIFCGISRGFCRIFVGFYGIQQDLAGFGRIQWGLVGFHGFLAGFHFFFCGISRVSRGVILDFPFLGLLRALSPQPCRGTMRAVLWDLLLLCLFARARGDCRDDCVHCDRLLYRDSFDVLVSHTLSLSPKYSGHPECHHCPLSPGGSGCPFPSYRVWGHLGFEGKVPPAVTVTAGWAPGWSRGKVKVPNQGENPKLGAGD